MLARALAILFLPVTVGFSLEVPVNDSLSRADEIPPAAVRAPEPGSLERVLDSFLRAYCGDNPAWRVQVSTAGVTATSPLPAGYQRGRSRTGIWYSYAPRTTATLTAEQRRTVMRDRRFAPFLAQMRDLADGIPATLPPPLLDLAIPEPPQPVASVVGRADLASRLLAQRRPPPGPTRFDISPEELLLPGSVIVAQPEVSVP